MPESHETLRLALWSVGVLLAVYVMMILFQSRERPWLDAAKVWFPFLAATLPLYLIIAWRMSGRPTDSVGLGLAAAAGTLGFVLPIIYIANAMKVESHWVGIAIFAFVISWHITALVIFVVYMPLQAKLAFGAFKALASLGPMRTLGSLAIGGVLVLAYMAVSAPFVGSLIAASKQAERNSEYSTQTSGQHLEKVYACLWKVAGPGAANGFPASEEALRALGPECWDPVLAPGGSGYGTGYDFRYEPGPPDAGGVIRTFAISYRARKAPGAFADSRYIDQTGLNRQASEGWATASTTRIESAMRSHIPEIMGALDAWHDLNGTYPARIVSHMTPDSAGPYDLVLWEGLFGSRSVTSAPDGTSSIEFSRGELRYTPRFATGHEGGGAAGYSVSIPRNAADHHAFRSYLILDGGRIHATGEPRDATEADPLAPSIEWPPGAHERQRALAKQILQAKRAP
jgi:hypothetical protein